jgi:hypothetical protein
LPKKSKEKPLLERRALSTINEEGGAGKLRRVLTDRGSAKFAKNLRASPFNKDLWDSATFCRIRLDRQYL